ncbi:hypothetical protein C1645_824836 [Glomus cerebriforme]|uniref:Uncharacterized protein n=1 Tax=Glomus cerebriforme TaxID=658196 RepID=A0A397SZN5_9GLOM|nr:hypothetical protein C1645_824836 [Glomus cerebriforme]
MFHFGLNNEKLKLNNYSIGKGLVIDQGIRICQYHSSSYWRALFSSYSLSILTPNILLDCWNREKDTEGVLFHILIRDDDDEVVMILGREGVKGIWPIKAKISASTKSLKDSVVRDVLGLNDVNKGGLFCDVLGWDDINVSRLFHGGWDDEDFL